MKNIYEVINANKEEALSLLRKGEKDNEVYYHDFKDGKEPWILVETGSNGVVVDAKVCSVELAIDGKGPLIVIIGEYSNSLFDEANDYMPISHALGYTEENVYEAIIEDLKE